MSQNDERFADLEGVIESEADLAELVAAPMPEAIAKVVDHIDDVCRAFIAKSPFCLIASANPDGHIDVSPKGDPPGFVRVLDDRRLAIPDRPGNRRVDTFHNLLRDPRLGMIFLIPGKTETLRVSGEARIVRDETLRRSLAYKGHEPHLAVVVYVERAFVHCPKCMIRGSIWKPEAWPASDDVPDLRRAMIRQAKLDTTPAALEAKAERAGVTKLY
ncbi:MAG: MSMEG_1061 family FMN-dependent PPOX-type flavoprotein [Pseudomonadota bacterium]